MAKRANVYHPNLDITGVKIQQCPIRDSARRISKKCETRSYDFSSTVANPDTKAAIKALAVASNKSKREGKIKTHISDVKP